MSVSNLLAGIEAAWRDPQNAVRNGFTDISRSFGLRTKLQEEIQAQAEEFSREESLRNVARSDMEDALVRDQGRSAKSSDFLKPLVEKQKQDS